MNKCLFLAAFLLTFISGQGQEIVLNELSASVINSQVDNYGEFEDWIEVYNSSAKDVNLAGWYLSDNPEKPLKWRIPDTNPRLTTVLAGSFLLFWADKDTLQGPEHLGFALNKGGEQLFLYRPGKDGPILADSIRYGALGPDQSFGRCPGQGNRWVVFKRPSPGKMNICAEEGKKKVRQIPKPAPDECAASFEESPPLSVISGITITINEICPNNDRSYQDGFAERDDWIELYNPGSESVNIAGWYISDTLNTALFHRIPSYDLPATLIPAGGYLILWADAQAAQGVSHLPFKLDKDGEELYLARMISGKLEIMDQVVFPKAKSDVPYGRIPNGNGTWMRLSHPSPMQANIPPRTISGFLLNELVAVSGPGLTDEFGEQEDWIEFYNPTGSPVDLGGLYVTDSIADAIQSHVTVYSPDSTTIPAGGYLVFYADNETWQGARHLSFKLASGGGGVFLFQPDGITKISDVHYNHQSADASYGRFPDGSERWIHAMPTPGLANKYEFTRVKGLFINELMSDNTTVPDHLGQYDDWVEIYNDNTAPVNIGGLYLTDSLADPLKFRIPDTFPDSTTIAAKGFMILWADNHPDLGVRHLDFKLAAGGESVGLAQLLEGGNEFVDSVTFPAQMPDKSYGRLGDGQNTWISFSSPTPNSSNQSQTSQVDSDAVFSVSVYPNPCVNRLNINILLKNPANVLIELFSSDGVKAFQQNFGVHPAGWSTLITDEPAASLRTGRYLLRITAGKQTEYRNLMLIK